MLHYVQLQDGAPLPDIRHLKPFKVIVVVEELPSSPWQTKVSNWLVQSGCLFMMAWGLDCVSWDDSVDYASLETNQWGEVPEDKNVWTTWHEEETLEEVFWFAKHSAYHDKVELENTLILHISNQEKQEYLMRSYKEAD